jgi:hypothetical protein
MMLRNQRLCVAGLLWMIVAGVAPASSSLLSAQPSNASVRQAAVDLVIGLDGSAESEFPALRLPIALTRTGGVLVPLAEDSQVREFDANGKFVRTIGRKGAGPGEFTGMRAVGHCSDTVWVADGTARRVTLFTADKKTLTETITQMPPASGLQGMLCDRALLFRETLTGQRTYEGERESDLILQSKNGAILMKQRVASGSTAIVILKDGMLTTRPQRLEYSVSQDPAIAFAPSGRTFAVIDRRVTGEKKFVVDVYSSAGKKLHTIVINADPVPLDRAFVRGQLDTVAMTVMRIKRGAFASASAAREYMEAQLKLPSSFPLAGELMLEDDGSVWVSEPMRDRPRGKFDEKSPRPPDHLDPLHHHWKPTRAPGRPREHRPARSVRRQVLGCSRARKRRARDRPPEVGLFSTD